MKDWAGALEWIAGVLAGAWLCWHFDYPAAGLMVLLVGLGGYLVARLEG